MNEPTLTDLRSRLAQPQGDALRDELVAQARALESRLRTRIAAGLPREEFPAWLAAAEAAAAAQEVLAEQRIEPSSPPAPAMAPTSFSYP